MLPQNGGFSQKKKKGDGSCALTIALKRSVVYTGFKNEGENVYFMLGLTGLSLLHTVKFQSNYKIMPCHILQEVPNKITQCARDSVQLCDCVSLSDNTMKILL